MAARYSGRTLTTGLATLSYDGLLARAVVSSGLKLAVVRWAVGDEAGLKLIRMSRQDASRLQELWALSNCRKKRITPGVNR